VNDPAWPGHVRLYEVHRGKHHPGPQGGAPTD
jgi:hypothetical protein